ncbi:hypothetical protein NQ315_000532 [Exocentrus adspersus]|uniref:Uncharacterized protein n=1 Tax=Exocentrus adspersus TaxID=1586481 RepID=A0AAV8VCW2_9CUCU|nr:hypothetical protein NQ315_000532 [Exocentrus adspersus]
MRRYCRENPVKYSLLSAARVSIHRDTDERATHRSPPRAAAETESAKSGSAGFARTSCADSGKAQVYPGHSKAKEPVTAQPLPQADVPPASQRTRTELTSQEVTNKYVSRGIAVVPGQGSL